MKLNNDPQDLVATTSVLIGSIFRNDTKIGSPAKPFGRLTTGFISFKLTGIVIDLLALIVIELREIKDRLPSKTTPGLPPASRGPFPQ